MVDIRTLSIFGDRVYNSRKNGGILWAQVIEELGAPYVLVRIDTSIKAHRETEFRKLNSNMLLPTLGLNNGQTFGENGAILLMLGYLHPESGMVPRIVDADRSFFLHWLFALATTGYTTMRRYSYPEEYTTQTDAEQATREAAWSQLVRFFDALSTRQWSASSSPRSYSTKHSTEDRISDAYIGRHALVTR